MVPTFLSRTLESLPGKPKHHIWGLMLMIFTLVVLIRVFLDYLPHFVLIGLFPIAIAIIGFLMISDSKMLNKELFDRRDWVVLRAISCAFWLTFFLTVVSDFISNGIENSFDMFMALTLPFIFLIYMQRFIKLLSIVKEMPSWGELKLVKRSDLEDW